MALPGSCWPLHSPLASVYLVPPIKFQPARMEKRPSAHQLPRGLLRVGVTDWPSPGKVLASVVGMGLLGGAQLGVGNRGWEGPGPPSVCQSGQ